MRWLNVHPHHCVTEESWAVVRFALQWRDGLLPQAGGVAEQSAWMAEAVDVVLAAWRCLRERRDKKDN